MKFKLGDLVRKIKGSKWTGRVVGTYSTALTPEGYCVESSTETGSVQIYPAAALELVISNPKTVSNEFVLGQRQVEVVREDGTVSIRPSIMHLEVGDVFRMFDGKAYHTDRDGYSVWRVLEPPYMVGQTATVSTEGVSRDPGIWGATV